MKRNEKNKQPKDENGRHEHSLPGEINAKQKKLNSDAHQQAERDIMNDAELSAHHPNDDLDESETARLGENTDLV